MKEVPVPETPRKRQSERQRKLNTLEEKKNIKSNWCTHVLMFNLAALS